MKLRIIYLILLLVFVHSAVHGQRNSGKEDFYHQLYGGLIMGTNYSKIDGVAYDGYNKWNISGGGVLFMSFGDVNLPFEGTVAMSLEVLYNQKGSMGKGLTSSGMNAQKVDLHYAEIPIQINLFRGSRRNIYGLGAALGYLGFSEETIEQHNGIVIKDGYPFHKFDLSFVITANIHLWKGFYLSPRFQYSMISIRNNNNRYDGRDEQFNNLWSFRLMYLFN